MKTTRYKSFLVREIADRLSWQVAAAVLLTANLVLAVGLSFNAGNERTVVVPSGFSKKFWVENDYVSREYLEEMAAWVAETGLTVSPESVDYKGQRFLSLTSPRARGAIKTILTVQSERLKRNDASQVFYLSNGITVDQKGMQTAISGTLVTIIGDKQVKTEEKTFRTKFAMESGEIRVIEFTDEVNADDPFGKKKSMAGGAVAGGN